MHDSDELHGVYLPLAETLGRRIAELHQAFALPVDDPAFRPEPVPAEDDIAELEDRRSRQQAETTRRGAAPGAGERPA